MCGRYVTPEQAAIERFWHIGRHNSGAILAPLWNAAPGAKVPIIFLDSDALTLDVARWGLIPHWWKDEKPPRNTHNARSEEAASKAMWRYPVSKARCLIPALGWYEWKQIERVDPATGEILKVKQPYFIHPPDGHPFAFAGLSSAWVPNQPGADHGGESAMTTCSILTQEAIGPAADVHDRMPVVLPKDAEAAWLNATLTDARAALELARRRAVTAFVHHAVNPRVNNARNEGAELIEAIDEANR